MNERIDKDTAGERRLTSFIAGEWAPVGAGYVVTSPGSGAVVSQVTNGSEEDVDRAVASAREAFETTRWIPMRDRAAMCERIARLIEDDADRLAADLSEEHGKPLAEAQGEVEAGARGFGLAAQELRRLDGYLPPTQDPDKRVLVIRQPRGVWALITPWNFPFNIPIEYLATAVATGSPFVWKPAPSTPLIAARLFELILEGGVPERAVNLLLTDSIDVSQHLVTHPGIDAVGLTGGAQTGRKIAQLSWDKHLLLELGGNGPVIILDDADLETALPAVGVSAFRNAGQVCSAAGRLFVADSTADDVVGSLERLAREIVLGPPADQGTVMGPLHTEAVARMMDRHVSDALERGAKLIHGGERASGFPTKLYYQPTVLDEVPFDALLNSEETFGPIAPVVRMKDDDEILAAANAGPYGLTCAVFTTSLRRAFKFAERLETGTVIINDRSTYWELHLPFGGRQGSHSGRGRLGGRHTMEEFTQLKTISIDVS
jgi:acyl-CoA reductase-like NAD-dependent aldehyde dehydrogenase